MKIEKKSAVVKAFSGDQMKKRKARFSMEP